MDYHAASAGPKRAGYKRERVMTPTGRQKSDRPPKVVGLLLQGPVWLFSVDLPLPLREAG